MQRSFKKIMVAVFAFLVVYSIYLGYVISSMADRQIEVKLQMEQMRLGNAEIITNQMKLDLTDFKNRFDN